MKIQFHKKKNGGYVLLIVMVLSIVGITFMAGSLNWANLTSNMTARNNEYFTTVYAAEAATARALSAIVSDYKTSGEALVYSKMTNSVYQTNVPNSSISSYWTNYQFDNGSNVTGRMTVSRVNPTNTVLMASPYAGLMSMCSTYQIVANANNPGSRFQSPPITGAIGQEVNIGTIPIFQFAIFYDQDLEIRPGPNMYVSGLVHGNHNIYFSPSASLVFSNDISSTGSMIFTKKPGDPQSAGGGTPTFLGAHPTNVNALNLPIGTNLPTGIHGVLEVPPAGESPTSAAGTNRLYNQADLVVLISNSTVSAKSGYPVDHGVTSLTTAWTNFITTNITFNNVREASTVRAVTIDVGKLRAWSATNTTLRPLLGSRDVSSIFIADMRTMNSTQQAGICLTNGRYLPSGGLTVVTPDPAYTIGDYNTSDDGVTYHPSTADTTHTRPAAIMCDAINILSSAWNPSASTASLSGGGRVATDTTVNAALLSGIVETSTSTSTFSGGVENYPRFLENWAPSSGTKTFTYNGSMVVLFDSVIANNVYVLNGTSYNSYVPPVRNWNFDENYLDSRKQPPLTPSVKTVNAPRWVLLAPDTTTF